MDTRVVWSIIIANVSAYTRARLSLCDRWLAKHTIAVSMERNLAVVPHADIPVLLARYLGVLPCYEDIRRSLVTSAYTLPMPTTYPTLVWCQDYHLRQRLQPSQMKNYAAYDIDLFLYGDIELIKLVLATIILPANSAHVGYIACAVILFLRGYADESIEMIGNIVATHTQVQQDMVVMQVCTCAYMLGTDVQQFVKRVLTWSTNHEKTKADAALIVRCINAEPFVADYVSTDMMFAAICSGDVEYIKQTQARARHRSLEWILLPWLTGAVTPQVFNAIIECNQIHITDILIDILPNIIRYNNGTFVIRNVDRGGRSYASSHHIHAGKYIDMYVQLLQHCDNIGCILPYSPPKPLYTITMQHYYASGQPISQCDLTEVLESAVTYDEFARAMKLVQRERDRTDSNALTPQQILHVYYRGLSRAAKRNNLGQVRVLYAIVNELAAI